MLASLALAPVMDLCLSLAKADNKGTVVWEIFDACTVAPLRSWSSQRAGHTEVVFLSWHASYLQLVV